MTGGSTCELQGEGYEGQEGRIQTKAPQGDGAQGGDDAGEGRKGGKARGGRDRGEGGQQEEGGQSAQGRQGQTTTKGPAPWQGTLCAPPLPRQRARRSAPTAAGGQIELGFAMAQLCTLRVARQGAVEFGQPINCQGAPLNCHDHLHYHVDWLC